MSALIPVEAIAEALADHRYSIVEVDHCVCGVNTKNMPLHQASVIAALPDIAIVPGESKRRYSAAYRNADGQVVPVGVNYGKRAWAEEVRGEWQRDEPEGKYFIAYRDVPEWQEITDRAAAGGES